WGGAAGRRPGRVRPESSPPQVRAGARPQGGGAAADAGGRLPRGDPARAQRARDRKTLREGPRQGPFLQSGQWPGRTLVEKAAPCILPAGLGSLSAAGQKRFRPVSEAPTLAADCPVSRSTVVSI